MTQLRKRMQEELQRRNYSESTTICYLRQITEFAKHFRRSPAQLGPEEIKQFQLYLVQEKKVSWATYIQTTAALRFLYVKTLGRAFMAEKIPYPKRPKHLPTVLSQEEIEAAAQRCAIAQTPCASDDRCTVRACAYRRLAASPLTISTAAGWSFTSVKPRGTRIAMSCSRPCCWRRSGSIGKLADPSRGYFRATAPTSR